MVDYRRKGRKSGAADSLRRGAAYTKQLSREVAAGRCRSVLVEVGGGEGEVAGAAVMELRLPSSGGLIVMRARQPRYWGHTLPLAGSRMRSTSRARG